MHCTINKFSIYFWNTIPYAIYNLASKYDIQPNHIFIPFGTPFHTKKISEKWTIYNLATKYIMF
jgi:hypothetical protein